MTMIPTSIARAASRCLSSNKTPLLASTTAVMKATLFAGSRRSIAIGTDLTKTASALSWQKARPWYTSDDEGSNMAADNATSMTDLFVGSGGGRTVAVFGVPAPFTGTCTNEHYPPYKELAAEFYGAGCDDLMCYAVSDPYAHYSWAKALRNDFESIRFYADPDGEWARALGLERDYGAASLGKRSARFSMIVKDGVVRAFRLVDDDATQDAPSLLRDLQTSSS